MAVALNLRLPITAVPPVLDQIQREEQFSGAVASLLVSIPVACFALFSTLAARMGHRWGLSTMIGASLVVMLVGFGIRWFPNQAGLFVGTAVLGIAITVGNVLLPPLVKRDHPDHAGVLTGLYSMALYLGAALGAGLTLPVQHAAGIGWRSAVVLWGVLPAMALLVWLARMPLDRSARGREQQPDPTQPGSPRPSLWASPTAWAVTLVFAIPALLFYALSAWLPTILMSEGMSPVRAGAMLSLVNIAAVPAALGAGILISRTRGQVWLIAATGALLVVPILGLWSGATGATELWSVLLGVGLGGGTAIGYALPLLRSADVATAARLTAMAQTAGFMLCATGPVTMGALHDITGSWASSLTALVVCSVVLVMAGFRAGRGTTV
ncbi:MFS transporter [Halostreptopolyspora alba]|uniref:MFS transporter n=1 Tax=Halostreptopolyspora alba TaxID=2487137 RepID=UPI003713ABCC